jgi:hypothetical protein
MKPGFHIEFSIWIWPRLLLFSVGKGAMNALRYWQWRNELLRDVGNCAMMPVLIAGRASPDRPGQPCWDKCEYTGALQREWVNWSAAYPYGAINFISALAIRFMWTLDSTFKELFFQTASQPTAGYPHIFFNSRENLYSSPMITCKHFMPR